MKTIAITVKSFARTARKIVGEDADVLPAGGILLWPDPAIYDMVLLFLHPRADGLAWVDDAGLDVLTVAEVERLPLAGSVVFVGACYGSENTALLDALWKAGAKAVIHGAGVNYGGSDNALAGADVLASGLINALRMGMPLQLAWAIARKLALIASIRHVPGAEDALEYQMEIQREERERTERRSFMAGLAGLLVLIIGILWGGGGGGGLLTTFSSIPAPPAGITWWQKDLYRNSDSIDWDTAIPITGTDTLQIIDTITATAGTAFTLVEEWDTSAITMTGVVTTGGGTLAYGTGVVTWTVASALTTPYEIEKLWSTLSGDWTTARITETLTTGGGSQVVYIDLEHMGWTPTPVLTWTPWYTPIPWAETPYPTSTPCAGIGCVPYDELPGIEYYIWLPLVMNDYSGAPYRP